MGSWYHATMKPILPLIALGASLSLSASAGPIHRSYAAKAAFAHLHPCPSTGLRIPHCPRYVIDHIIPLCAGGEDASANMQWQEHSQSLTKDRAEWRQCAALRRGKHGKL